jgi:SIR2-like protein
MKLVERLYAQPQRARAMQRTQSTSGLLRLAEEFEAEFGRHDLDKLLLAAIPDDDYEPGPLHELLLSLPWADVFTTNYDTLLEKARRAVIDRHYQVVLCSEDIPSSKHPRIIKLHGSFPSVRPFVITEEDFRRYPRRCAAMVNLAQQSIVENIFCLIGFSGDDPNFLQWTGWVRDNLGNSVRQIYLVGLLTLTSAQRNLLIRRQVTPIDLSPLFRETDWPDQSVRYQRALEWFLLSLEAARPPNVLIWPRRGHFSRTAPSPRLPAIYVPPHEELVEEDFAPV